MRTSSTWSSVHTVYTQNRPHTVAEKDSFIQTDIVVAPPVTFDLRAWQMS